MQYLLQRLPVVLELTMRSLNALLETLHHSHTLYVPLYAARFVAVDVYPLPAVFLLLGLALHVRR